MRGVADWFEDSSSGGRGQRRGGCGSAPIGGMAREGVRLFRFAVFEWSDGLAGSGGDRGLLAGGFEFLFGEDEAADVAKRFFPDGHLFEVILPDGVRGGAGRAASEGLALDGDDFTVGVEASVFLGRKEEGDLGSFFPEVAGELVGEEQSVIAAAGGKSRDGLFKARPFRFEIDLEPLTEFKPMDTSAQDDDAEKFFASHGRFVQGER